MATGFAVADTPPISLANVGVTVPNKQIEISLKNCGELMKAGIMFHKKSPYFKVCADVVLVNPPGTLPQHSHSITPNPPPVKIEANGTAEDLKTISIGNK